MPENAASRSGRRRAPARVVVAGAGIAGVEALLALRDLAGERVELTLLAPHDELTYRPMSVYQAFEQTGPERYPLGDLLTELNVEHHRDRFRWLDPQARRVHTEGGATLPYEALLLALGARRRAPFEHAVTIDDRRLDTQLQPLVDELDRPSPVTAAMIVPSLPSWPLPIYELALMSAARARRFGHPLRLTVVTPEGAPLEVFGARASDAVAGALADAGIELITAELAQVHEPHVVSLYPSNRRLEVDAVYVLPELFGPSVPGVPTSAERGFISVDQDGTIRALERVYAAGDAVDFPVKLGGVSAQQADTAATAIAALAGAPVSPTPMQTTVHTVLLGAEPPIYLSAQVSYLHGINSEVSDHANWDPSEKISARYLSAYLEAHSGFAAP